MTNMLIPEVILYFKKIIQFHCRKAHIIFSILFCRHVVFSSTQSQFSATSENKFSGITDAIHRAQYKGDESAWHQVRRQISIAIHAFRSAVLILKPTDS